MMAITRSAFTAEDMTMAGEPVVERIRTNIVESLKEMTRATGAYRNATVYEPSPADPPPIIDYRLTVLQEEPDDDPANGSISNDGETIGVPDGLVAWMQTFAIVCDVVIPEDAVEPMDRKINRIRADVEKMLRDDPQRGLPGAVADTVILSPQIYEVDEGFRQGRIVVRCRVHYRTYEDDPYSAPGIDA